MLPLIALCYQSMQGVVTGIGRRKLWKMSLQIVAKTIAHLNQSQCMWLVGWLAVVGMMWWRDVTVETSPICSAANGKCPWLNANRHVKFTNIPCAVPGHKKQ
jgi:tetrahydromethanopterin S-methyltransferase subunit C